MEFNNEIETLTRTQADTKMELELKNPSSSTRNAKESSKSSDSSRRESGGARQTRNQNRKHRGGTREKCGIPHTNQTSIKVIDKGEASQVCGEDQLIKPLMCVSPPSRNDLCSTRLVLNLGTSFVTFC